MGTCCIFWNLIIYFFYSKNFKFISVSQYMPSRQTIEKLFFSVLHVKTIIIHWRLNLFTLRIFRSYKHTSFLVFSDLTFSMCFCSEQVNVWCGVYGIRDGVCRVHHTNRIEHFLCYLQLERSSMYDAHISRNNFSSFLQ